MKTRSAHKPLNILIIVLVVLLALSGTALAGTVLYRYNRAQEAPAVVTNNIITAGEPAAEIVNVKAANLAASQNYTEQMGIVGGTQFAAQKLVDQESGREVTLKIYINHSEDTAPFKAENLFPGDAVKKTYNIEVSYKGSLALKFRAKIKGEDVKLAEVLKCKVIANENELYDGYMKDMSEPLSYTMPQNTGGTETVPYTITVYLDTSVGNEYKSKALTADFEWWVDEKEDEPNPLPSSSVAPLPSSDPAVTPAPTGAPVPSDPPVPTDVPQPTVSPKPSASPEPDVPGGELLPPATGDDSNIVLWISIAGISLFLLILLIFTGGRKKEGKK